ncbi:Protein of unknown function [Pelagibacterium luteolum]|uniref:DUF2799 domain-containing protein n=2 Tax=Pelagibacterium luteolum TaxID=440168 RepID=A0A1G7VHA4_9HYPH|nr:Protein of unknown function [Pelagibacterium luteolum]
MVTREVSVMKNLGLLCLVLLVGAVLAACASLSEEQCQSGDWRTIGFSDGAEGRPAGYVTNHSEACSEYGIVVDQALYGDGRVDGLRTYCRLANAERQGRSGERYYGVCEGELGVAFARVLAAGQDVYEARADINSLESEIDSANSRLRREGLTPEQVAQIQRDLFGLRLDRQSLQRSLRLAEMRLQSTRRNEEIRLARLGSAGY